MSLNFTPGKKAHLRRLIEYQSKIESQLVAGNPYYFCNCFSERFDKQYNGTNNPFQTENERISQILSNSLGGRITFGNFGQPYQIDYLGNIEGQPGGSKKPPRNKF